MPAKGDTPGLQQCDRGNGRISLNWVCSKAARAAGYPIKSRNLDAYACEEDALSAICNELQEEQDVWLAEQKQSDEKPLVFDGTINSILDHYETHPLSPYRNQPKNSRDSCDAQIRVLRRTVGKRRLEPLQGINFMEWYWQFRTPKVAGERETITKAGHLMDRLRAVFTFAVLLGVPDADRLRRALELCRFERAAPRTQQVTYEQTVAFIAKAHELGFPEMALAQALQFELALRQTDAIGKWDSKIDTPNDKRWVNGIRWSDISQDRILTHKTGKRGRVVSFPLDANPLVRAELDRLGVLPNFGPIVIDSSSGKAFQYETYKRRWRQIADAAGIAKDVWNRDSRAGGVTEAGDAGADKEDMRQLAGHANARMTEQYNRPSVVQTGRVADLRVAHRERGNNQ